MPIIKIPSAAEVREGGGDDLVRQALEYIEPILCQLSEGVYTTEARNIIDERYDEKTVCQTAKRLVEILIVKGWKARIYEKNGRSVLEVAQPTT